jgi:hypothetical protein
MGATTKVTRIINIPVEKPDVVVPVKIPEKEPEKVRVLR